MTLPGRTTMTRQNETAFLTPAKMEWICSVIYFNRRVLTACILAGMTAAFAIFRLTAATYPSEAKLLVRYVSESAPLAPNSGSSVVASGINAINSEIAILESRDLIEKVVDSIGLERFGVEGTNETQRLRVIRRTLLNLTVSAQNNSNIIYVRYAGSDPLLARDFLASLVQHYMEKHSDIHRDAGAYEFLAKQTDQLRARLTETEAELRTLKEDTGIISLEESAKTVLAKVEDLERQQRESETALAASVAKINMLRPASTMPPTNTRSVTPSRESSYPPPGYQLLIERLRQLQTREAELLYSYMAESEPVQAIRTQIAQTQQAMETEIRKTQQGPMETTNIVILSNPQEWNLALREEEAECAALQARSEVLKNQLAKARAQSQHLAALDERMVQLQRNKELQEQNYRYFSKRLEQARVDNALDAAKISSVVVVQPPSHPIRKHRDKVPQKMALAMMLGLATGLAAAFTRERVTNASLKTPSQVAPRLGLPLLLSIPHISLLRRSRSGIRLQQRDMTPASQAAADLHDKLYPYYEALRDRITSLTGKSDGTPFLLGIAGCHRGAGVSTLAAGLAAALARNDDGHILIVDADVDHASAHRLLPPGPARVTSMLGDGQGNTVVIQPNLYMLSCCEATGNPAPINVASGILGLARTLNASNYRYVIFDLPPVNDISMALRVAPSLDGIVLVLEAGAGSAAKASEARDLLNQTGLSILGIVLNKTKIFLPSFLGEQT